MKPIGASATLAMLVLVTIAATGAKAAATRALVVDKDGAQCANADFTSIQAAVDAAHPGNLIRVCPDLYTTQLRAAFQRARARARKAFA